MFYDWIDHFNKKELAVNSKVFSLWVYTWEGRIFFGSISPRLRTAVSTRGMSSLAARLVMWTLASHPLERHTDRDKDVGKGENMCDQSDKTEGEFKAH